MENEINKELKGYTTKQLLDENEKLNKNITTLNKELVHAFIAGFNDGEGCIRVGKRKNGNMFLLSTLTNTNLEVLTKMKNVFGGIIYNNSENEINHKDSWKWNIQDKDILKTFLETILPYSTVKKQQIIYALKYIELTTNCHNKGVSREEQNLREFFYDKLKEMKNVEYTKKELKIFENKINDLNTNHQQPSLSDY